MTVRYCTRRRKPYGETIEGVVNAARTYAPFCSKRCADVDLVHWLKGDYVIGDDGDLSLREETEAPPPRPRTADDEEA